MSVLVPVLNEEEHLRETAEQMLGQDYDGPIEFLFVDGGSHDATPAILEELTARDDRIVLLANPRRCVNHALNIGLHAARGEFIARMDAHTLYPPGYLTLGVARLRDGDVVSVSGPQIAVGDGRWSKRVALALESSMGVGGARFRRTSDEEFEVDSGFTGMWRRSTLLELGGWDEDWSVDEDTELAARLSKAGGRHICVPSMAAEYIPRDSLLDVSRQYWSYGSSRVRTARRHPESLRPSQLLPPALIVDIAAGLTGPHRLRRIALAACGVYLGALLTVAVRSLDHAPRSDAAVVPVVHATMHLSYGAGVLAACLRHGPPLAAVGHALARLVRRTANRGQ